MNLVVKRFSLEGLYEGIQPLQSVFDSLCCANDWPTPMRTKTNQRQSCRLNSHPFEKHHMFFYELYIIHKEANKTKLINIPLRVASFTRGGNLRNQVIDLSSCYDLLLRISSLFERMFDSIQDNDVSRWQLTKRFFNIDVVSGSKQQTGIDFVRYLSSLSIRSNSLQFIFFGYLILKLDTKLWFNSVETSILVTSKYNQQAFGMWI